MNFNPADFMGNIKDMQNKMKDVQSKLKNITSEGISGGGLVKVQMNGDLNVLSVKIDPIAVDPRDIEMLQDLIIAAMNSAQSNIKEKIEKEMLENTGIKLPFDFNGFK
ncbi:MAG: YbaB/EbfC family nucleoid-associated protein [Spirochaetales bacterium]|nr:YbaB/EbfC family nucleoid-associated protein [Spirochaetales bacterium]